VIPSHWKSGTLGDEVEILDSKRVPVNAKERADRVGAVPYYGATGQVGLIDEALFNEELVLLGEDGAPFFDRTRDVAYRIQGPAWVNNHAHVLRAGRRMTNRFLMHQLNQVDYRPFVSGTTRAKLPQGPMKEIPLVLPPLDEQHRIVAAVETHFSRLDAAVASLTRAKANVKRARASVLKAAVEGRLVPTEAALARAEGREYEPATVLLERILAERKAAWAASGAKGKYKEPVDPETAGLPELPEGWCWASVDAVTLVSGGITKNAGRAQREQLVPYLRVANVYADDLRLDDVSSITVSDAELARLLLQRGDLLIVEGNGSAEQLGRVA
jgi:type I restriction enzyme S subunit